MMKSPASREQDPVPPIPQALYDLGAASGLLRAKFSVHPTVPIRVLDRLLRSPKDADGPASYAELLALARKSDSIDAETGDVNAKQELRYSLRRFRELFGEDFFEQIGEVPHCTYERRESDIALAQRFSPVMEASIEHAAKLHLLATNRPVLLEFAEHLFRQYKICDPVEQEILRSVVLLAGLPFNFKHRNPNIMRARVEAFKSIREKLDGLRREVVYMRDGKPKTRQFIHPIGARNTIYFSRPEWLAGVEGFHSLEEIIAAHRRSFGRTFPVGFLSSHLKLSFSGPAEPAPAPATTRVAIADPRFSDPRFDAANRLFEGGGNVGINGSRSSTLIKSVRLTTPEGQVFRRRRGVGVVDLPSSAPSSTSAPAPQSPESPGHS